MATITDLGFSRNAQQMVNLPLASRDQSLRDAMRVIDRFAFGAVLIADKNLHLEGIVTDGDIRRAILAGIDLETTVGETLFGNSKSPIHHPITALAGSSNEELLGLMQNADVRQIPLLDSQGRVTNLVTFEQLVPDNMLQVEAVIVMEENAFESMGKFLPKQMLPVGTKPLLELTLRQLRKAGIHNVHLASTSKESAVGRHFGDGTELGMRIRYCRGGGSTDGHGVLERAETNGGPVLVLNAGVLTRVNFRSLLQFHREHRSEATVAVRTKESEPRHGTPLNGVPLPQTNGRYDVAASFNDAGIYVISGELYRTLSVDDCLNLGEIVHSWNVVGRRVIPFALREYWIHIRSLEDYQRLLADEKHGLLNDSAIASFSFEAGVPPAAGVIPLSVPEFAGNEWKYVKECLDTGWVSSVGPFVDEFEKAIAKCVGVEHGIATCTGTAALHTALLVAGVEPNDEVIVPTLTFIAPVNAIRYVGAWPVFMDVDPDYWQMDVTKLVDFLKHNCVPKADGLVNKQSGRRISAVLPVSILGHPCDLDPIIEAARRYGLAAIEDASESLGSLYKGQSTGSLGDIACFSFNGNKLITTGGGGMIVTNDAQWARRSKYLTTQAKDDPLEYIHNEIGYNYRLTNLLAAIGCAQLESLGDIVARKRRIAETYAKAFTEMPGIVVPKEAAWARSTYWLYTVLFDEHKSSVTSRSMLKRLAQAGIQTRPLWHPIHSLPPYTGCEAYRIETSNRLYETALSLPCSVGLTESEQQSVIRVIRGGLLDT